MSSFVSDIASNFIKSKDLSVARQAKNAPLQRRIEGQIKGYDTLGEEGKSAYEKFLEKFNANEPTVGKYNEQEKAEVDKIYGTGGGSLQAELERLRNERAAAREQGLQRGFQFALGAQNRSRLLRDAGGPSSYDRASLTKTAGDLAIQSLLEKNAQERGDFGVLNAMRQGSIGRRTEMDDALNRRAFVPYDIQSSMYGQQQGRLQNLINMDQQNMFYAPYEKANSAMSWAKVGDSVLDLVLAYFTGGASLMGGGGVGSGASQQSNWLSGLGGQQGGAQAGGGGGGMGSMFSMFGGGGGGGGFGGFGAGSAPQSSPYSSGGSPGWGTGGGYSGFSSSMFA